MRFSCAHCGKGLSVQNEATGRKVNCPSCRRLVVVPVAGEGDSAGGRDEVPPSRTVTRGTAFLFAEVALVLGLAAGGGLGFLIGRRTAPVPEPVAVSQAKAPAPAPKPIAVPQVELPVRVSELKPKEKPPVSVSEPKPKEKPPVPKQVPGVKSEPKVDPQIDVSSSARTVSWVLRRFKHLNGLFEKQSFILYKEALKDFDREVGKLIGKTVLWKLPLDGVYLDHLKVRRVSAVPSLEDDDALEAFWKSDPFGKSSLSLIEFHFKTPTRLMTKESIAVRGTFDSFGPFLWYRDPTEANKVRTKGKGDFVTIRARVLEIYRAPRSGSQHILTFRMDHEEVID